MAVTLENYATVEHINVNSVTVNMPSGLADGDVIIVSIVYNTLYGVDMLVVPDGWTQINGSTPNGYGLLYMYWHTVTDASSEPAAYTWQSIAVETPPAFWYASAIAWALRGADTQTPIGQMYQRASFASVEVEMTPARNGMGLLIAGQLDIDLINYPLFYPPPAPSEITISPDDLTEIAIVSADYTPLVGHTTRTFNYLWGGELADRDTIGPYNITSPYIGVTGICIALLINPAGTAVSPKPPLAPGVSGSGWHYRDGFTLGYELYSADSSGTLTLITDAEIGQPTAIDWDLRLNGIGAATDIEMQMVRFPTWSIFTLCRVWIRLEDGSKHYLASGLVRSPDWQRPYGHARLVGLDNLVINDFVAADYPDHVVYAGQRILTAGAAIDIGDFETYVEYMRRSLAMMPDCAYGVGPDLYYVQGKPQDGTFITLDAKNAVDISESGHIVTNYLTKYRYIDNSNALHTVSRNIGNVLAPVYAAKTELNQDTAVIIPDGFETPLAEEWTYSLRYPGIVVPPAKIINLPRGEIQFVASASIAVTGAKNGSPGSAFTTLTTGILPYDVRRWL